MLRTFGLTTACSMAMAATAQAGPQFVDENGVANFGYDVVAYHTTFEPTEGSSEFVAEYNGAPFWFASAENRDRFAADPERYAPAYDGHCAQALTFHKKLVVDPEAFSIVDMDTGTLVDPATYNPETTNGLLHINYSPGVNRDFNKDVQGNIHKADYAWIDCLDDDPAAVPRKRFFSDLGDRDRPGDCPAVTLAQFIEQRG